MKFTHTLYAYLFQFGLLITAIFSFTLFIFHTEIILSKEIMRLLLGFVDMNQIVTLLHDRFNF